MVSSNFVSIFELRPKVCTLRVLADKIAKKKLIKSVKFNKIEKLDEMENWKKRKKENGKLCRIENLEKTPKSKIQQNKKIRTKVEVSDKYKSRISQISASLTSLLMTLAHREHTSVSCQFSLKIQEVTRNKLRLSKVL